MCHTGWVGTFGQGDACTITVEYASHLNTGLTAAPAVVEHPLNFSLKVSLGMRVDFSLCKPKNTDDVKIVSRFTY